MRLILAFLCDQAAKSNLLGATPNRCLKLRVKSDEQEKPQSSAIAVNDFWLPKLIRLSDFSSRKRLMKSLGVSPTIA